MPTETEYRRICRRECEWCAKGVVMGPDGSHVDDTGYANWRLGRVCTAPTPIQVIERLTAELAAANKRLEVAERRLAFIAHGHPNSVDDEGNLEWQHSIRGTFIGTGKTLAIAIDAAILSTQPTAQEKP